MTPSSSDLSQELHQHTWKEILYLHFHLNAHTFKITDKNSLGVTPPPRLCLRPVVPGEVRAVGGSGQPFPAVPQWLARPECDVSLPLCWPPGPLIPCTQDLEPQGIRDACPSIPERTQSREPSEKQATWLEEHSDRTLSLQRYF